MEKKQLAGWGNYPVSESHILRPESQKGITIEADSTIPRGLGRSYGDAALNAARQVVLTERLNRFLAFDPETGILRAEAGVALSDILTTFVPKGWFLPVTPGTKEVTLGGCFAVDVHGKNHHIDGTISQYVKEVEVQLADGTHKRYTPDSDLFWATAGGMGLTGLITELTLQLIPIDTPHMIVQHRVAENIDTFFEIKDEKYTVAWIDCLAKGKNFGRSIVMHGRHAKKGEADAPFKPRKKVSLPFNLPSWVLNPISVRCFNQVYYSLQGKKTDPFIVDYDQYFYPLDAIDNWNRLYGKRGFIQYQFVVPTAEGLKAIFKEITKSQRASFLAVLKRLGPEGKGPLSFPMEGYTLALDFPLSGPELFPFLDQLDALVLKYGGRVYLAKDARLSPENFRAMYPRYVEWLTIKKGVDPNWRFSSDLSRRLKMEEG